MSKRIKQITEENFPAAIDYACKLHKKMQANVLAKKIVLPLGSIAFALHAMIMLLGALYMLVKDDAARVIAFHSVEFVISYWNGVWVICQSVSELVYVQVILMILYLFLVPFAISSVAAVLISLTTKGKKLVVQGDAAKKARQLHDYLDNAPRTYFEAFDGSPVIWRRTSGIISGILIMVFLFYYYGAFRSQSNDFMSALLVLFQSNKYADDIILCIFFGGIFYVLYAILHYIFTLMLQPYFDSYQKWSKFIDEAERYWLSVDKDEREERARKEKREKERRASTSNSSSSRHSSPGLSYVQKADYINRNFGGIYSFSAIQYIENDPSLSASEKEEMIIFLRAYGD